jgi:type I restriction enzyme S subunit
MNWLTAPLRKVAPPVAAHFAFKPGEKVWHLSLDQIESKTGEIVGKRYAAAADAGTSTFCFDGGIVLYSKLRPYLNKVAIPDEPGIATTELIPLRPNPKTLNARFLAYYLRSPAFVNQASHHVAGAKMPRVVMDWFWEHEAPIPSPKEQSRIVELLDEADRLRRLRREADAKAARILPALFLKMFGDPATNPMGWPMKPLGDLLSDAEVFVDGDWVESKDQDPDGEVRLIQLADIGDGFYIDKSSRFLTKETALRLRCTFLIPGDVLVARMPDPLGRACIFPGDEKEAVTVVDVCVIRPGVDGPDPYWLMHCINSAGFRALIAQQQTGTTRARISRGNLSRLPIICPPPPLQRKFSVLSKQATEALSTAGAARKIEQLFELLLQRAFSGQLTAKWREAHMKELLAEMEQQARLLNLPLPSAQEALA